MKHTQYFWDKLGLDKPTKKCNKCKKEKLKELFSIDTTRLDGRYPSCCECKSKYNRELYRNKPDMFKRAVNKWENKNKYKQKAFRKLCYAIKTGKIIKPKRCQLCGSIKNLDAHHWHGYDEDNILDVQWLCRACHKKQKDDTIGKT